MLLLALVLAASLTACTQPNESFNPTREIPPPEDPLPPMDFSMPFFDFPTIQPSAGSGTASDPWQISTPEHLAWIGNPGYPERLTGHYLLMNDITAPNNLVIAHVEAEVLQNDIARAGAGFLGSLDGNNHTITVNIYLPSIAGVGLFRLIGASGRVSNLSVVGQVDGHSVVGGLAAANEGEIISSTANVEVTGQYFDIGGLIGINNGFVQGSSAMGTVRGLGLVGGLIGLNIDTVEYSYATGNVDGLNVVGGLIGVCVGAVQNSFATGNVSGLQNIGGLVGAFDYGTVSSSVALGAVIESTDGAIGRIWGTGENNFAVNNHASAATLINGQPITGDGTHDNQHGQTATPEELATETFWRETMGWDFDEIWIWDSERSLPTLRGLPGAEIPLTYDYDAYNDEEA